MGQLCLPTFLVSCLLPFLSAGLALLNTELVLGATSVGTNQSISKYNSAPRGIPAHMELWPEFLLFNALLPSRAPQNTSSRVAVDASIQRMMQTPRANHLPPPPQPEALDTGIKADEHLLSAYTIFSDASCAVVKQKRNVLKMSQLQMETPEGHRVFSISSHG